MAVKTRLLSFSTWRLTYGPTISPVRRKHTRVRRPTKTVFGERSNARHRTRFARRPPHVGDITPLQVQDKLPVRITPAISTKRLVVIEKSSIYFSATNERTSAERQQHDSVIPVRDTPWACTTRTFLRYFLIRLLHCSDCRDHHDVRGRPYERFENWYRPAAALSFRRPVNLAVSKTRSFPSLLTVTPTKMSQKRKNHQRTIVAVELPIEIDAGRKIVQMTRVQQRSKLSRAFRNRSPIPMDHRRIE